MKLADYRNWVQGEVNKHCAEPHVCVRGWADTWAVSLGRLIEVHAGFELASLVIARWEFLGSLLIGHTKPMSDQGQALAYATAFLEPLNSRYGAKHPTIIPHMKIAEILFRMLRNKSLHGFTPAPLYDPATDRVIGWWMDTTGLAREHLQFHPQTEALQIDGQTLRDELVDSMRAFASHLETNAKTRRGTFPREDFTNGFAWRLYPHVPSGATLPWSFSPTPKT
jgi:hypothetical protein